MDNPNLGGKEQQRNCEFPKDYIVSKLYDLWLNLPACAQSFGDCGSSFGVQRQFPVEEVPPQCGTIVIVIHPLEVR